MNILVTGGMGFIGSHIVEYHLSKGDELHVVDDLSIGNDKTVSLFEKNPRFHFEKSNILVWPSIVERVGWADRIYHMAAVLGNLRVILEPVHVIASNIAGTERIFRAVTQSGKFPRVIAASSSGVYGNSSASTMNEDDPLVIENPAKLRSNYSISKLCDEIIGLSYDKINNIPTTMIRLFNTIGPRQTGSYGFVLPRFIKQACLNQPMTIYGDGNQTRSFCDVRDVVVALDMIAENMNTRSNTLNVGLDREITIKELAEMVRLRANSKSEFKYLTNFEVYGMEFNDIRHRKPDLSKFYKLTGFKHKWTLEKTIDDLITEFYDTKV
jgi:UDP-glucose 4-epimerase